MTIDPTKTYTATFDTTCGKFTATLDAKNSPKGVNNFVFLDQARSFYNGLKLHRVVQELRDPRRRPHGKRQRRPGLQRRHRRSAATTIKTGRLACGEDRHRSGRQRSGNQFFVDDRRSSPRTARRRRAAGRPVRLRLLRPVTIESRQRADARVVRGAERSERRAVDRPLYIFSVDDHRALSAASAPAAVTLG